MQHIVQQNETDKNNYA